MSPVPHTKKKLSSALREISARKPIKFTTLAQRLKFQPATLRTWIQRNRFPEEALIKLADFFGWGDPALLDEKYIFELTDPNKKTTAAEKERQLSANASVLTEALDLLDLRIGLLTKTEVAFGDDLERLFRLMTKNDVMIHCSLNEIPFEMLGGWAKLKATVRTVLNKGAHFIYLYPDSEALNFLSEAVNVLHPATFTATFSKYIEDLAFADKSQSLGIQGVKDQVHAVAVPYPVFMPPKHSYRLFQPANDPSRYRVFAHFPTGSRFTDSPVHLPLAHDVSEQFYRFVRFVLRNDSELRKIID